MKHCMLDIETLATGRDAAIKSIGALLFDPKAGKVMDPRDTRAFYRVISLEKSRSPGVIDPATVSWWMGQSQEARDSLFGPEATAQAIELEQALAHFALWVETFGVEKVWSNGPLFDERLMREAAERNGLPHPFHYRASRCFRTAGEFAEAGGVDLKKLHKELKAKRPAGHVAHKAIDDCWSQAIAVCEFYRLLNLQD